MLDTRDNINETVKEFDNWIDEFDFSDEEIDSRELDYLNENEAL